MLDEFSNRLVRIVREMSDDDLLTLVRCQLDGVLDGAGAHPGLRQAARQSMLGRTPRGRATRADRHALLATVEKVVKRGSGLSASEVAAAVGVAQTRAASAIKELKKAKRIFQGGDRRFARYAGDTRTATAASLAARRGG